MTHQEEYVLGQIRKEPGLRAMQLADKLNLDMDDVEAALASLKRTGQILEEKAIAPNQVESSVYRTNPGYLGWKAPGTADVLSASDDGRTIDVTATLRLEPPASAQPTKPAATTPATPPVADVVTAALDRATTKVQTAIDYLRKNGPTDANQLRTVMGLPKASHPSSYLAAALRGNRIVRIDDVFSLGPKEQPTDERKPVQSTKPESAGGAAPQKVDSSGIDGEVIDVLRSRLSPAEFRGYLKANVIEHTLFSGNSPEAYHRAGLFIDLLSEAALEDARSKSQPTT